VSAVIVRRDVTRGKGVQMVRPSPFTPVAKTKRKRNGQQNQHIE